MSEQTEPQKTRANFYLDPGYYERLKAVAAKRGISTSEIVRTLVRVYVDRAEAADATDHGEQPSDVTAAASGE